MSGYATRRPNKKAHQNDELSVLSGRQDSNLRPSRPMSGCATRRPNKKAHQNDELSVLSGRQDLNQQPSRPMSGYATRRPNKKAHQMMSFLCCRPVGTIFEPFLG